MNGDAKEKKGFRRNRNSSDFRFPAGSASGSAENRNADLVIHTVGASLQFILGVGVVTISVSGLVHQLWLSTFFSILGSITIMTGLYSLIRIFSGSRWSGTLTARAVRRAIEHQN